MGEHDCIQEKELGALASSVESFRHELFGAGGSDGLVKQIPALSVKIDNLNSSITELRNVIDRRNETSWKGITTFLMGLGIVASIIFGIINASHAKESDRRNEKDITDIYYLLQNRTVSRGNSVPFDSLLNKN
jgi:hypothetical protein